MKLREYSVTLLPISRIAIVINLGDELEKVVWCESSTDVELAKPIRFGLVSDRHNRESCHLNVRDARRHTQQLSAQYLQPRQNCGPKAGF